MKFQCENKKGHYQMTLEWKRWLKRSLWVHTILRRLDATWWD